MSFQNSYGPDGSININVVPSFGHIINVSEQHKLSTVSLILYRLLKLKDGEQPEEPSDKDQLTLTPADMLHSVPGKLLKIQLPNNISMNMLKDPD